MTDNSYVKYISEQAKSSVYRGTLNEETYELDIVDDPKEFVDTAKKMGIKSKIVTMKGPGGGNPVVSVTGNPAEVMKFLKKAYDPNMHKSELKLYKV